MQALLIMKTSTPLVTQICQQDVIGEWSDPLWDGILEGARAVLPELLAGNHGVEAIKRIGTALKAFWPNVWKGKKRSELKAPPPPSPLLSRRWAGE